MTRRVRDLLESAVATLHGRVDDPATDAQLLLSHSLGRDRSWLFAWPEHAPEAAQTGRFLTLVEKRHAGEPVAYLTGRRAFWSLDLQVTPATLIPRPETEHLVETALELALDADACVLDLGTGSGAIALALGRERPAWTILATDVSAAALEVARRNAVHNEVEQVAFRQGDWFDAVPEGMRFSLIVSNPPYVADRDPHLAAGDLRFEPRQALAAGRDGTDALRHLIANAPGFLAPGGWLWLEHGALHGATARQLLTLHGFEQIETKADLAGLDRCSGGRLAAL
ncbi:MAG: peptide chain release factor N(5)-glutamine methyltransferase [Chromatiaceae bacterium]|jgi:release factor glutamine methyltransferase